MIALDFKLTSGQVRALLFVYHGSTLVDKAAILEFFHTGHFITAVGSLIRKGLVTHTPPPHGDTSWVYDATVRCYHVTDSGRALAKMIVGEAEKIVALEASRIEYEKRYNAAVEAKRRRRPRAGVYRDG